MSLDTPNRKRITLLFVIVAHIAALMLAVLIGRSTTRDPVTTRARALTVISVNTPRPPEPAVTQPATSTPPRPNPAVTSPEPLDLIATADIPFDPSAVVPEPALQGEACDLAGTLAARLSEDPAVRDAIGDIPVESRSVANAIMIWDGRWKSLSLSPSAESAPDRRLRWAVMKIVYSASEDCRNSPLRGPRLIPLRRSEGTVLLAFGSGRWAWGQLLDSKTP